MAWTIEEIRPDNGPRDPYFNPPEFYSRRRAERWARKHTCEHVTYLVRPASRCSCGGTTWPPPPIPVAASLEEQPIQNFEG